MSRRRTPERSRSRNPGRRRVGWRVAAIVGVVSVLSLLVVSVTPFRSYLNQKQRIGSAERQLQTLERQNRDLSAQVARLQTPAEIERQARAQYGMIRPGEIAYAVLPAATGPLHLPQVWPYQR